MARAGEFDKTVTLSSFTEGTADGLGHKAKTYTVVRKCAARLWIRSTAQLDNQPAEFPAGTLRLLLRLPPKTIAVGWRLTYTAILYEIADLEWRDDEMNCLVTLDRVP